MAVRARGDAGVVWRYRVLILALAAEENVVDVCVRDVGTAPDGVVRVPAETRRVRSLIVAELHAEHAGTHESVPHAAHGDRSVGAREGVAKRERAHRVATVVLASRIELTTLVVLRDVEVLLVDEANNLDVAGRADEMRARDRACGDHACTVAASRAPRDFMVFGITDRATLWWTPEAEVLKRVDDKRLAHRVLTFGGRVASVVAFLHSTVAVTSVCHVWDFVEGEVFTNKTGVAGVRRIRVEGRDGAIWLRKRYQ